MKQALQKLASEIAKREAGKSQVKIGDIRQILKVISTIHAEARIAHHPRSTQVLTEYSKSLAAKIRFKRAADRKRRWLASAKKKAKKKAAKTK